MDTPPQTKLSRLQQMNERLFSCIDNDDMTSVLELLAGGVNPDCRDLEGNTPLHWAASANNTDLTSILLAHGADVDAAEISFGCTPLITAANEGFVDIARLLLKEGALVNGADSRECTPLHYATANNQGAMVDLLLAHGASPDIPNDQGELPLHVAASYYHVVLIEAFVRATYADDSSTDEPPDPGCTALDDAPDGGHSAIFSVLLKHSSLPDLCNKSGDTPLHLAARDGYHKVVCQLLEVTTQIDTAGYRGYTPLHLAAAGGHSAVISTLLKHGVRPDCQDNFGETPLHLAVKSGHVRAVREMLAASLKPNIINNLSATALHLAVADGKVDIARILLINGAAPNLHSQVVGPTPLHFAIHSHEQALLINVDGAKQLECIDLLLASGARTDIADHNGLTPLARAKDSRNNIIVNKLANPRPRCIQPLSLQRVCRAAIRARLIDNQPRQPLSASIDKLDCLPSSMKVYLYSALTL